MRLLVPLLGVLLGVIPLLLPPNTLLLLHVLVLLTVLVVLRMEADEEIEDEDEEAVVAVLDGTLRLDKLLIDEALLSPEEPPVLPTVLLVMLRRVLLFDLELPLLVLLPDDTLFELVVR